MKQDSCNQILKAFKNEDRTIQAEKPFVESLMAQQSPPRQILMLAQLEHLVLSE